MGTRADELWSRKGPHPGHAWAKAALSATVLVVGTVIALGCGGSSSGDGDTIKVAGVWPLTGPFAQNGLASRDGAQLAVDEINEAGGIEALDGAELELEVADTGASTQTAVTNTRNLLNDPSVVAGLGSWLTSFTVATSEVAQRAGAPWLSESFGDEVTDRGYEYVFDIQTPTSVLATFMYESALEIAEAQGREIRSVAIVGDNTVAAVPAQEDLERLAEEDGLSIAVSEQWSPPLQDASGIAQEIQSADVDIVFEVGYSYTDEVQLNQQLRSRNVDAIRMQLGGQALIKSWRSAATTARGLVGIVGYAPDERNQAIADRIATDLGEPYANQDQLTGYMLVQVLAAALEEAGDTDRDAVRDALSEIDIDSGPVADLAPGNSFSFNSEGRVETTQGRAIQWQDASGEVLPCTILPQEVAACAPE